MCSQCFPLWYWIPIFFTVLLWSRNSSIVTTIKQKDMLPGQSIKTKNTHSESWLGLNIFHVLPEIFINVFIALYSLISKSLVEVHQGFEVVVCHWSPLAGHRQLIDAVASFTICWVYADFCVSPRHSVLKVSPAARSRTHQSQPLHMLKCCWTVEISIKFIFRDWIKA